MVFWSDPAHVHTFITYLFSVFYVLLNNAESGQSPASVAKILY